MLVVSMDDCSIRFINLNDNTTSFFLYHSSPIWCVNSSLHRPQIASCDSSGCVFIFLLKHINSRKPKREQKILLYSLKASKPPMFTDPVLTFTQNPISATCETIVRSSPSTSDQTANLDTGVTSITGEQSPRTVEFPDELVSMRCVRWNPHSSSGHWLMSSGASGLVRVHSIRQEKNN